MLKFPYDNSQFHFNYNEEDSAHSYEVPEETRRDLYLALLEIELAYSIAQALSMSNGRPELRYCYAIQLVQRLLHDAVGLHGSEQKKAEKALRLLKRCEIEPDEIKDVTDEIDENALVAVSTCLIEILEKAFTTKDEVDDTFQEVLFEHIMVRHMPEYKHLLEDNPR